MASDTKLTVSLILNDASFSKQLNQINKDLKLNQSEIKNAGSGIENFGNTINGVQTKLKSLSSQFESQGKKIELYKNEISKTKDTLADLTKTHSEEADKLEKLRSKYDTIVETMGENSVEAKKLNSEIKSLEKSKTNLENRIISTNSRLTNLNTGLNNSEAEFKDLDSQIAKTSLTMENFKVDQFRQKMELASTQLKSTSDKLGTIGKGFNDISSMMAKVSLPIIGLGTAATKVSIDFESSMSKVKSVSGATSKDMELLTKKAREMGATTSKSASDAADALGYMGLAGWNTQQMLTGLEPILRLSEAGTMDLGLASDLTTDSMSALKIGVGDLKRYLDITAMASVRTNSDIQQLLESFVNVGSTTSNLGISLEESAAALGVLANNGTKGYEAGTKLNSILTRMTAQSTIASKAWDRVGVEVFDAEGRFRGLTTVLSETKDKFGDLTQEQQQYFLKQVAGTDNIADFVNLMHSTNGEIQDLTSNLEASSGALMDVALTMQDNVKGQFYEVKSKLEELGLQFGEILLPILSKFLDKIGDVATWFSELSPATQETIVKFGLFSLALNGVTKGLGTFFQSASTITGLMGKITGAFGKSAAAAAVAGEATTAMVGTAAAGTGLAGAATAFGGLALAAAPWIAGAAAITAAGYGIYKTMSEEVVPAVDLFADKVVYSADTAVSSYSAVGGAYQATVTTISEETKKAVQSYVDLDNSANEHLVNLYMTSTGITAQTRDEVAGNFNQMGTMIKSQIQANMSETTSTLTNFFNNSKVMTEQHETDILAMNDLYYQRQQEKVDAYEKRIYDILNNASMNKRVITTNELETITDIRNEMREMSINAYSKTEEEAQLILGRLASYDGRISAEIASKHIQEAERKRLETVDSANQEYMDVIKIIEFMRDDSKVITAAQADDLIKEAERQRDDSVEAANQMKKDVVEKIGQMNKDVLSDVDETTGNLITKWDKFKNWWDKLWFSKKTMEVETVETKTTKYTPGSYLTGGSTRSTNSYAPQGLEYVTGLAASSARTTAFTTGVSDSIEVPNSRSYMNDTVNAISTIRNKSSDNDDIISVLNISLQETQKQNNLLMSLVSLMQQSNKVDVSLDLDGRTIAKASAKYMKTEIDTIQSRKNRLGGNL